jgi:hypothetical protein
LALQDLVRFLQTFVLLNLYREIGRYFLVSAAYYLTVADISYAGVTLNRNAAVAPALMYQVFMSIVFRLEVSNYDDPRVALATCIFQGVLEIALCLTALERDAWVNGVTSRLGCVAPFRRWSTALVIASVVPDSHGQAMSVVSHSTSKSPQSSLVNLRRVEAPKRVAAFAPAIRRRDAVPLEHDRC